jgi:hypothetical protein
MSYSSFVYRWSSRDLRKIIMAILKSWLADNVKRINYVQNYVSKDSKTIQKNEEKILLISANDENKLNDFLSKNFSQIEKIDIK